MMNGDKVRIQIHTENGDDNIYLFESGSQERTKEKREDEKQILAERARKKELKKRVMSLKDSSEIFSQRFLCVCVNLQMQLEMKYE